MPFSSLVSVWNSSIFCPELSIFGGTRDLSLFAGGLISPKALSWEGFSCSGIRILNQAEPSHAIACASSELCA